MKSLGTAIKEINHGRCEEGEGKPDSEEKKESSMSLGARSTHRKHKRRLRGAWPQSEHSRFRESAGQACPRVHPKRPAGTRAGRPRSHASGAGASSTDSTERSGPINGDQATIRV